MIRFRPLWETLEKRGMKRTDLTIGNKVITSATLAKLGADSSVNTKTIDRICAFLGCGLSDVAEFVPDDRS